MKLLKRMYNWGLFYAASLPGLLFFALYLWLEDLMDWFAERIERALERLDE